MKKKLFIILTCVMVLCMLAACGQSAASGGSGDASGGSGSISVETGSASGEASGGSSEDFDVSQLKTLGDVFDFVGEDSVQEGYDETHYVMVFAVDDVNYRVISELPQDVSEAIWAIDFEDEERDQKVKDLLSPVEVTAVENLNDQIPSQEELDKYVGKTGQELFDEGWNYWYYNLEDMEAGLNFGPFAYNVKFEYEGEPMENSDDFDFYEAFKDLKVSAITYEGVGDATSVE